MHRLRAALGTAGYTADGVLDLLGPDAHAALARGETVPARRRTAGGSPLETLVRLFLLQLAVPARHAAAALPLVDALTGGLLELAGDDVRARLDIRPYGADDAPEGGWWLVSDLGTGLDGVHRPLRSDHVLGLGGASASLAELTPRRDVGRALDIGTGCGVQALHLSRHAQHVVATDVLPRALALARLTAALNDVELDLREGSLTEPVAAERFDLVVSNPPFVIGAPDARTYRDAGMPLDGVTRRLLQSAPDLLADGGTYVALANWVRLRGEGPEERIAGWLPDAAGFESLVLVRDEQDPAAYVSTWLRDAGEEGGAAYAERYDRWLDALEAAAVESIAFGWVMVRRYPADGRTAGRAVLACPQAVEQPLGDRLVTDLDTSHWLRDQPDDALLRSRLRLRADVQQEQVGRPGAEDPESLVLRQQRGLRNATRASTATAALVGACDGSLPLATLVDAVATVLGEPCDRLTGPLLADVRALLRSGFLTVEAP